MTTKTTLTNEAMILLGKDLLVDLDTDNTPSAEKARAIYDQTLKDVLTEHNWSFATREATLLEAPIPAPNMSEYAYYYELPQDYVSIIQDNDDCYNAINRPDYRIEANYVLANSAPTIKYIALMEAPSIYPAYFSELLSLRLAYKLAYSLVSNVSLRDELFQLYTDKLSKAKSRDQREDKSRQYDDNYYDRVKLGSYTRYTTGIE